MIGANGIGSTKKYNGGVFYYTGENSRWSFQQLILTNEMMNEPWTFYGTVIDLDPVTNRILLIGCSNCTTSSSYINDGIIFIFTPISFPQINSWTEQQKLTSNNLYAIGGTDAELYENTLIGVGYTTPPKNSWTKQNGIIFQKDIQTGIWSEIQTLTPKTDKITDVGIFEDTIVISSKDYRYQNNNNAGAVLVFYPNSIPFNTQEYNSNNHHHNDQQQQQQQQQQIDTLNNPPEPIQWSQQQTLYTGNTVAANLYYGSTVQIWGNTMAITEPGSGYVYVLERETRSGMWSQQVTIQAAISTSLTVALRGSDIIVSDGTTVYTYTNNLIYNCLYLTLEDHFGDGWDLARLIVESPFHGFETYAPDCDTENPLELRFCPTEIHENGHYKFKIINSEKAAFRWEIIWRIFEERSGNWYVGNWDTIMEFDWGLHENGFFNRKIIKSLPPNITCVKCSNDTDFYSEPKLQPHKRVLGAGPKTRSPTISPAPTIIQNSEVNWRYIRIYDTASLDWFNSIHRGTSYYISDINGLHLFTVGTLCAHIPGLCWIDLPNGQYTLRVGGALDVHKSTHLWKFCKITNSLKPQSHLEFTIENENCLITSYYTRDNFCKHVKDYSVVLKITFDFIISHDNINRRNTIKDIHENNNNNNNTNNNNNDLEINEISINKEIKRVTKIENDISYTLTTSDIETLKGILSSALSSYQIQGLHIVNLYYTTLEIQLYVHPVNDVYENHEVFHSVISDLSDSVHNILESSIPSMLIKLTTSSPVSSYFHHILSMHISSVIFDGITGGSAPTIETNELDTITTNYNQDESQSSSSSSSSSNNEQLTSLKAFLSSIRVLNLFGWSIWILFSLGIIFLVVRSTYLKIKNRKNKKNNEEELKYFPLDTSIGNEIDLEINQKREQNRDQKKEKKEKKKEKRNKNNENNENENNFDSDSSNENKKKEILKKKKEKKNIEIEIIEREKYFKENKKLNKKINKK